MSKERLEEIKDKFNKSSIFADTKDIQYLIEQAERVEELENEIERLKDIYYQCKEWGEKESFRCMNLEQQNKRYREYLARLKRATNRYPAEDMAYVVNKITSEALEGDSDE